jgi:2-oxopent-4-enoate/cis-2-oxohex-4-enoate hydratase
MEAALIRQLGDELHVALRAPHMLAPLTERHATITNEDAYQIQRRLIERREADGERIVGKKIGLTSEAVQKMLGVGEPDFGFLMDRMQYANGAAISLKAAGLMQAKAEGEIALVLGSDLSGSNITREQVLDATAYVSPCFEIVDSRVRDWKIRIQDTIADNASCGVFVLGEGRVDPRSLDLAAVKLELRKNGALAVSGLGSAVQGHPAEAVAWLANMLGRFGVPLRKGEVILSGALAAMVPVAAGDRFDLSISGLGDAAVSFSA